MQFNLDKESIDFTVQIDPANKLRLPAFIFNYLNELKTTLNSPSVRAANLNEMLFMCETLIDYSWEMLNTNLWCFVDNIWRLIYSYSMLYKILFTDLKSNDEKETLIKLCDLGLLMSGPLLEKQFNQIVNFILKENQSESPKAKLRKIESSSEIDTNVVLNNDFKLKIECSPSYEFFNEAYFSKNVPVIIDGQMNHWPAMNKWRLTDFSLLRLFNCFNFNSNFDFSIDYIINLAGKRTVPIELGSKYTDENWSQKLMTIEQFIEEFILIDKNSKVKGYLAQHPLFDQVIVINYNLRLFSLKIFKKYNLDSRAT